VRVRTSYLPVALAVLALSCKDKPPVETVRASVTSRSGSDTATVRVTWRALDTGVVFPWRSAPLGAGADFALADTAKDGEAVFQVGKPAEDMSATFCLRGVRVADGKETGEACTDYVIPAQPPPLPDPGELHLALVHESTQYRNPTCLETREICRRHDDAGNCTRTRTICARSEPQDTLACLTLRWDSVPGASGFRAELRRGDRSISSMNVNDDSCPGCSELGFEGDRWPCFEYQQGCRFNVWPYFSAAWCVDRREATGSLEARVSALRDGELVVQRVEWTPPRAEER
jgi:hypothetical protein